jgi:hypothetical protein
MNSQRFDDLVRTLPMARRRSVLAGLAGGLLAALPLPPGRDAEAKKKNKKKRKKLKRNEFGCVDVGKACRGKNGNCCSGICDGKKPKPGEKDKSRCQAHDESTCVAGQTIEECGGDDTVECETTSGRGGVCATTTGKGPYCFFGAACLVCEKDEDCEAVCGAGAACFPCSEECRHTGGTACGGLDNCSIINGMNEM